MKREEQVYSLAKSIDAVAEYRAWMAILQKCANPNNGNYSCTGAKGIKVCPQWLEFKQFFRDMGRRHEGTELSLLDRTKDYEPGNCCWLTKKEHQRIDGRIKPELLPGDKFNSWTVIGMRTEKNGFNYYPCRCECGFENEINADSLRFNQSMRCKSCANRNRALIYKKSAQVQKPNKKLPEKKLLLKKLGGFWLYKCTCGEISIMSQYKLAPGTSTLCRACRVKEKQCSK